MSVSGYIITLSSMLAPRLHFLRSGRSMVWVVLRGLIYGRIRRIELPSRNISSVRYAGSRMPRSTEVHETWYGPSLRIGLLYPMRNCGFQQVVRSCSGRSLFLTVPSIYDTHCPSSGGRHRDAHKFIGTRLSIRQVCCCHGVFRHDNARAGGHARICAVLVNPNFRKMVVLRHLGASLRGVFCFAFQNQSAGFATLFRIFCVLNRQLFVLVKVDGSMHFFCEKMWANKEEMISWEDPRSTPRRR